MATKAIDGSKQVVTAMQGASAPDRRGVCKASVAAQRQLEAHKAAASRPHHRVKGRVKKPTDSQLSRLRPMTRAVEGMLSPREQRARAREEKRRGVVVEAQAPLAAALPPIPDRVRFPTEETIIAALTEHPRTSKDPFTDEIRAAIAELFAGTDRSISEIERVVKDFLSQHEVGSQQTPVKVLLMRADLVVALKECAGVVEPTDDEGSASPRTDW